MKYIFNENGDYLGICEVVETGLIGIDITEETIQIMNTLVKPKLVNSEIVEGATQEEINEFNKQLVPTEVALWKLRFVLSQMGLEQAVTDAISVLPEPQRTAATYIWNFGTAVERYSPTVTMIKAVLNINDEEADNIFIQANQIVL